MYRNLIGSAMCLAILFLPARAADEPAHGHHTKCAKACADCALSCAHCNAHCTHLVVEGSKHHGKTMRLCNDCSTICSAAAAIVGRAGPLSVTVCESCAKACDECAKGCEAFKDDKHMADCAKACRDCAKACREMIEHAKH